MVLDPDWAVAVNDANRAALRRAFRKPDAERPARRSWRPEIRELPDHPPSAPAPLSCQ